MNAIIHATIIKTSLLSLNFETKAYKIL